MRAVVICRLIVEAGGVERTCERDRHTALLPAAGQGGRSRGHLRRGFDRAGECKAGIWASVANPKRGAVLGSACALVVEAGGADVGVAEPVLDAGDVGLVLEGVGGGGGP